MKASYLIPFLGALSVGAAGACAPTDDTSARPECDVRYADVDGDRRGDPSVYTTACAPSPGSVDNSKDCDDQNPYVNADEEEICDGVDNDCRATTSEAALCARLGCTPVVNSATGTSYLFCSDRHGEHALDVAQPPGFRPGQIDDEAEDDYLAEQIPRSSDREQPTIVRLGGGYARGVWRWADGRQFWPDPNAGDATPYTNWRGAPPSDPQGEVCLVLGGQGTAGWTPARCGQATAVLWERDIAGTASGAPIERCAVRFFDADGDRMGDPLAWTTACEAGPGWVDNGDDCNDHDPDIHSGAAEVCDGRDNDCDAATGDELACKQQWCKSVTNATSGSSYLFCDVELGATADVCWKYGFHPGKVETETENDFLIQQTRLLQMVRPTGIPTVVLGGTRHGSAWTWADGTPFAPDATPFANWDPGAVQSEDTACLMLYAGPAPHWREVRCGDRPFVLCESS